MAASREEEGAGEALGAWGGGGEGAVQRIAHEEEAGEDEKVGA